MPEPSRLSQPTLYYQNGFVKLKIYSVDLLDITKRRDDIAVAYMVADMVADKVADMAGGMFKTSV